MLRQSLLFALATTAACSFGDDRPLGMTGRDAGPDSTMDGPPVETGHLLITEAKSTLSDEFIEIWNPTERFISLGNYYLSDYGDYWKFPNGTLRATGADFIVGFPNMMIAPNQVIVVAYESAPFRASFINSADYALDLAADDGATKAFTRYRLVNPNDLPSLTNTGEPVVLFYWDGESDLVKDVDIAFAGPIATSSDTNRLIAKVAVDGPDLDTTATPYTSDDGTLGTGTTDLINGSAALSYKRIALEGNSEIQNGRGNGITGDDETSENLTVTWESGAGSAPTPGTVAASLLQ
jgi:uncharacterized protein